MIVNDKILTYGPNNDVLIDQIGPFIHIYFRRTILSGPKHINSSLSRGNILFENFISLVFQTRNLVVILEWAESPNYGVQRFKMNFKNIHLPMAYSGINSREIF